MNKKVFVVIVTYNGAQWIDKNITSLLNSSYPVNVIAIDNNSHDSSVALLKKFSQVHMIKSEENLGFGKANNIGIRKALEEGADYVFLLNQDAWVFEDTIARLVEVMEQNVSTGIVSPAHYLADEKNLDANFKTYLYRSTPLHTTECLFATKFVNAAAWMLSRKCIEKVGLFEPLFSHYGEDRNYCDRVLFHKFFILIGTNSKIVHDRNITRNFKKDTIQSQYKILCTLLNPNKSLIKSYALAFKEVAGLPKFFSKHYGFFNGAGLFGNLLSYYIKHVFAVNHIKSIRKSHR